MADGILVRGDKLPSEFFLALMLAPIFGALAALSSDIGYCFVISSVLVGASLFWAILMVWLKVRPRTLIWITTDGFAVQKRSGRSEYSDSDVTALGFHEEFKHEQGVAKWVRRTGVIVLATDGPPRTIRIDYLLPAGIDELVPLLDRLLTSITDRARKQIEQGQKYNGPKCTLDREGVWVVGPTEERLIPYTQLAAVTIVDRKVAIWEHGHELPFLTIPAGQQNARVVMALVRERIDAFKKPHDDTEPVCDGLGRILFQRDRAMPRWLFGLLLFLTLGLFGLALGTFATPELIGAGKRAYGFFWLAVGFIFSLPTLLFGRNKLVCQELGVSRTTLWGTSRLRYTELASFTYAVTRRYSHGVYTGTGFSIRFVPKPEVRESAIKFDWSISGVDQALDNLRDFISQILAQDMYKRLCEGELIHWCSGHAFTPEGLSCPGGLLKSRTIIFYNNLDEPWMDNGVLYLRVPNSKKAFASLSTGVANFFPGYVLLCRILQDRAGQGDGSSRGKFT